MFYNGTNRFYSFHHKISCDKLKCLFLILLVIKCVATEPHPRGRSLDVLRRHRHHQGESLTDTYNHSEDNGENSSKQDQGNGLNRSLPSKLSKEVHDEENEQHQQMLETLNNVVRIMGTAASSTGDMSMAMAPSSEKEIDDGSDSKSLVARVVNLMQISKNNADVITQAFRFVRLDAHLSTLLSQLSQLRESQESLQAESIKQQTKFNIVLDEIRSLANNIAKESTRLTEVEERLESEMEMMSDRIDTAIEKVIQSAVSTQILLDLSKETIQQTDKSVGISNEVLTELKSVRSELGDVGQASVQAIYNVQKLEESLLMAMEETGNKTIYALRQDQQLLQYQLVPAASPMKMNVDEVSLVPLGNSSIGNFMQADGTILPESTSLPAAASSTSSAAETGAIVVSPSSILNTVSAAASPGVAAPAKNDEEKKQKTQQNMQGTKKNVSSDATTTTAVVEKGSSYVSSCLRTISPDYPRNCEEIQLMGGTSSGVYRIYPFYSRSQSDMKHNGTEVHLRHYGVWFGKVYCDLQSDGGGWTVIQRRKEAVLTQEDFEKTWQEYSTGFGTLHDSHWLGLDTISELTKMGDFQLRIEMTDWEGESRVAEYGYFRVANVSQLYRLYVTDYSGNAGDSLAYHNGMAFTTKDHDNDLEKNVNCAQKYQGAWWYKSCHQANLNGLFIDESDGKHESYANGVNWYAWHGYYYSLKRTEMKVRRRNFKMSSSELSS